MQLILQILADTTAGSHLFKYHMQVNFGESLGDIVAALRRCSNLRLARNYTECSLTQTAKQRVIASLVEGGLANAAGIISLPVLLCGIGDIVCGFLWLRNHGRSGIGQWSGFPVSSIDLSVFVKVGATCSKF